MKTIGIIAEYNPFHSGHHYQIEAIRKITGADYVVVVMSGNFMQRGTPAILNKYERTTMALSHGADLVIELPVCFATASAEFFAYGGIELLNRLGIVDYICFGSECGDLTLLAALAELLLLEPSGYKKILKDQLKSGLTFPRARNNAVLLYLTQTLEKPENLSEESMGLLQSLLLSKTGLNELTHILASPNNILGIEYLKALKRTNSRIKPLTIKREGAAYHDNDPELNFCSASSLRKLIEDKNSSLSDLPTTLPQLTTSILRSQLYKTYPIVRNDFSTLLYYRLSNEDNLSLTQYADVSMELANRIHNLNTLGLTFDEVCDELKTKELTMTRINRALLHVLLGITNDTTTMFHTPTFLYARVLGFKKSASLLLKFMKTSSTLPLLMKVANASKLLSEEEFLVFLTDIKATHLYNQVVFAKFGTRLEDEYTHGPVILEE